jgi:hypothetical protein
MSCNCPKPNQCAPSKDCLCGVTLNIYNSEGTLVETVKADIFQGESNYFYVVTNSTAFNGVIPTGYELTISYNYELERWEMTYFDEGLSLTILLGVLYGVGPEDCPENNCWDLDCNAVAFNNLGVFNTYFSWQGEYVNSKKSYTFSSDWSGPVINYKIYWTPESISVSGSNAPLGTPAWILEEEISPGVFSPVGFLFNDNECPYGTYIATFGGIDTRFSFDDLGVTGFDMQSVAIDCGCCDESVVVNITINDVYYPNVVSNVVTDEYGNSIALNGYQYYLITVSIYTFYLYYTGTSWVLSEKDDGTGIIYAELSSTNSCPFGPYELYGLGDIDLFNVVGSECFDCCNYYAPSNSNLLKKKKAIFVKEIADIRNQEIFGLKCGPSWDDLFKKHLIFDVLHNLPDQVICEEEEQCLINKLSENCKC